MRISNTIPSIDYGNQKKIVDCGIFPIHG